MKAKIGGQRNEGVRARVRGPRPRKPPIGALAILSRFDPMASLAAEAEACGITQQAFLLAAIDELGMTRKQLGLRLGVTQKTIGKWLSAPDEVDYRRMNETVWKYLAEILLAHVKARAGLA